MAWFFFGSMYEDAADVYVKSANSFKLAKSWVRAGSVFVKLSSCHLKSGLEPFSVFVGALSCLVQAVDIFLDIGRHSMAARYCKEIGELYELEKNIEKAILYFDRTAEYFDYAEATSTANQCKGKVAEFSAQLEKYSKAIKIYEEIAWQSLNNNLLRYSMRKHLLNAGLCQLCRGNVVAVTNSLEEHQDLDPTFSRTREYKFLADLATAIDEEDVAKFTGVVKEFDSISPLDPSKKPLLLRVKNIPEDQRNGG